MGPEITMQLMNTNGIKICPCFVLTITIRWNFWNNYKFMYVLRSCCQLSQNEKNKVMQYSPWVFWGHVFPSAVGIQFLSNVKMLFIWRTIEWWILVMDPPEHHILNQPYPQKCTYWKFATKWSVTYFCMHMRSLEQWSRHEYATDWMVRNIQ